jgi:fibro-slime domain-containing protein
MTASDTGYFEYNPDADGSNDPAVCKGSTPDMVIGTLGQYNYPRLKNFIPCVYNKNVEKWFIADPDNPTDKKKVLVFEDSLVFEDKGNDVYHHNEASFFPLDGRKGTLVDRGIEPDLGHNYGFTIHIHVLFKWNEANMNQSKLHFTGGDDVWMFVDGTLVMDHGGIHDNVKEVHFKKLIDDGVISLKDGKIYPLDVFYASRDNSKAHFNFGAHADLLGQVKFDYQVMKVK